MGARRSLHSNRDHVRQQEDMGTQTPKAAGSNPSTLRATEHSYAVRPPVERKRTASVSSWHGQLTTREAPPSEERHHAGHDKRRREQYAVQSARSASHSPIRTPDIPEQLAELLMTMIPGSEGEELAEAYREGTDLPPITRQSLGELDIQNIITNIRLRHDINFDRDLSFRPNLDGAKGQEKVRSAHRYWRALVAELELYNRLFRGTPPLQEMGTNDWPTIVHHAERRIPKIFQTIRDVLKSLVPDRDHSRVDEHLDVAMLMQQIERGICDLVGLSEWMSCLLKEHCAPMRDEWVDKMVSCTRTGVTQNKPDSIVKGLCELLGILESMKLVSLVRCEVDVVLTLSGRCKPPDSQPQDTAYRRYHQLRDPLPPGTTSSRPRTSQRSKCAEVVPVCFCRIHSALPRAARFCTSAPRGPRPRRDSNIIRQRWSI